jgi:small nuclear ribonucleoprotein G
MSDTFHFFVLLPMTLPLPGALPQPNSPSTPSPILACGAASALTASVPCSLRSPVFHTAYCTVLPPTLSPSTPLTLAQYMEKKLFIQLNANRKVLGILRGYDVFLNIVLDEAVEEKPDGSRVRLGMVVIRGNSVVMLEALERVDYGRGGH